MSKITTRDQDAIILEEMVLLSVNNSAEHKGLSLLNRDIASSSQTLGIYRLDDQDTFKSAVLAYLKETVVPSVIDIANDIKQRK
ncbi:hypothetical protein OAA09_00020 [bacterium]|nr:hypothetical protein [bacterium]